MIAALQAGAATEPKARGWEKSKEAARVRLAEKCFPMEALSRQPQVVCAVLGKNQVANREKGLEGGCAVTSLPHILEDVPAQPSCRRKTVSFCRENKNPCAIFKS